MFCQNCGNSIPEQAKFCTYCGKSLNYAQAQSGHSGTPPYQTAANPMSANSPNNTVHTDLAVLEKSLKKFITPNTARNIFIVSCILAIPSFLMLPLGIGFTFLAAVFAIIWAVQADKQAYLCYTS